MRVILPQQAFLPSCAVLSDVPKLARYIAFSAPASERYANFILGFHMRRYWPCAAPSISRNLRFGFGLSKSLAIISCGATLFQRRRFICSRCASAYVANLLLLCVRQVHRF
ncbi:hypothetical protein KCP74_19665 [Salmonella enterica subsp. enterica]|nr:hypothetical protein KCP74_19665 [Salmonella enterica subsp. enterica]